MPGFCISCGSPLAVGAKFCEKCGAAVAGQAIGQTPATPNVGMPAGPAAVGAAAAPAPAAAQGSNTAIKVIFAVLGVFVFLALLAAGSCFYIGYRVRQRAKEFSREMGTNAAPYTGQRAPCSILTAGDASSALGQPVTSATAYGNSCEYRFGPAGNQRINVQYTWEGGAMTMKLAHGAMKSITGGMDTFTSVADIGDEAYVEPGGSGLLMRKGDVMVNIDLRVGGLNVDAAEKMARKIADRL